MNIALHGLSKHNMVITAAKQDRKY